MCSVWLTPWRMQPPALRPLRVVDAHGLTEGIGPWNTLIHTLYRENSM